MKSWQCTSRLASSFYTVNLTCSTIWLACVVDLIGVSGASEGDNRQGSRELWKGGISWR